MQHFKDQFGQSQQKGQQELSGERISGPASSAFSEGGSAANEEGSFVVQEDDVELEKSNILMLGPTGLFLFSYTDQKMKCTCLYCMLR